MLSCIGTKHHYLHAFEHQVSPSGSNLSYRGTKQYYLLSKTHFCSIGTHDTPLFTCFCERLLAGEKAPIFTVNRHIDVIKHQFLHAFVQWLKTSLFTRLWSRNIMGWTLTPPKPRSTKINLRENIIFENELSPNLIFYMLLDTSPTSSRNISFYRIWWASMQIIKKHYTCCPPPR